MDEFTDELAGFVDNKALRKTGGHREAERVRQKRDNATIRAMFSNSSLDSLASDATSRSASFVSFRTDDGSAPDSGPSPVSARASSDVPSEMGEQHPGAPSAASM